MRGVVLEPVRHGLREPAGGVDLPGEHIGQTAARRLPAEPGLDERPAVRDHVAEQIGGLPSLTAVLVILTGILGAISFPTMFRILRVRDHAAQGFAVGLAAHGLGTARAFLVSEEMGAFSALAMGLNGLLTAVLLPLLLS